MFLISSLRTKKPRRGLATSNPCFSSSRAASRTGARLTPSSRAMPASTTFGAGRQPSLNNGLHQDARDLADQIAIGKGR